MLVFVTWADLDGLDGPALAALMELVELDEEWAPIGIAVLPPRGS